jgi:glycosyltransferase involved in cell wall biosynthesis
MYHEQGFGKLRAANMRFSIVTACLNRKDLIDRAIQSVLAQEYPDFEHIVIDGGSSDGTLRVLEEYPHLKVTSEPDQGMYDAWNKGLMQASGEIIGFLNSDDRYLKAAFREAAQLFADDPKAAAVSGGVVIVRTGESGTAAQIKAGPIRPETLYDAVTSGGPKINAWFFRKEVFSQIGLFDAAYKTASDRDFMIRFAASRLPFVVLDQFIYEYSSHPDSLTFEDRFKTSILDEDLQMAQAYSQSTALPRRLKAAVRWWRQRFSAEIVIHFLKIRKWDLARHYFMKAWAQMPAWPLFFFTHAFYRLARNTLLRVSGKDRM